MANRTFDVTINHVQRQDNASVNETTDGLEVGAEVSGTTTRAFLKFDTNYSGMHAINSATLHVRSAPITGTGHIKVKRIDPADSWSAAGMTWANQPGVTGAETDVNVTSANTWYEVDVTALIKALAPTHIAGGSNETNRGLRIMGPDSNIVVLGSIGIGGYEPYITVNYDANSAPDAPTLTEPDNEEVVNDTTPNFEFTHNDDDSNEISAYEIEVRAEGSPSDWSVKVWDSGKDSTTDETPSVTSGVTLTRGTRYFFRVRTWDEHDAQGAWSSGRAFTIASLPVAVVTSPGTDTVAPLYYTAGSDTTPKFKPVWTFTCDEGGTQTSASIKIYDEAGTSLLHTYAHSGSAVTAEISDYAPTNGTKYQISVTPTCSHGAVGAESSKKRCRVRWGRASYRADLGSAPTTLSVAVQTVLNSGQVIMDYASSAATTPEPSDYKADIADVTKLRYVWHRATLLPQVVAAPTSPQLLDVVFSYSANVLVPDDWVMPSEFSIDQSTFVYGTQSLKGTCDGAEALSTQTIPIVANTNYVISGRIKTSGDPVASVRVVDSLGNVLATASATADTDWIRYTTDVFSSGALTEVTVQCRIAGAAATFAWFDALKLEASLVVTPWTPGFLGTAVTLDAGGMQVDASRGGIFRLRGADGGSRDTVSLLDGGLEFGGDTELTSESAGLLHIEGLAVAVREACMRIERSANQTIGTGSAVTIVFNTIINEDDEAGDLSLNTSTGVVTVARAGWYLMTAGLRWGANTTGVRSLLLQKNGNTIARQNSEPDGSQFYLNGATLVHCDASDTLNVQGSQDSGGNLDVIVSDHTHFSVMRVRG